MNINEFSQKPVSGQTYAKNEVPAFVISTQNTLLAILTIGNETVFQGSYAPDFDGNIKIDFAGLYDDYLETLIPTGGNNLITHTAYSRQFTATFYVLVGEDVSGEPATLSWNVANATLKSSTSFQQWSQQNFLTNQPIEKTTNYEAPEWLTWLALSGSTVLDARFYPKSGGAVDVTVTTQANNGCYSANVRYSRLIQMANLTANQLKGYYDLILYCGNNEVCRQRYIYEERSGMEKYYCFVNALGGIDTLICPGDNVLQPETTHNVGRFNNKYTALDDTDNIRQWSQNTGMMPNKYRNWIFELLTAKQGAEKYDPAAQDYYEIVVKSSEIAMGDHGQLASATFGYILNDPVNVMRDTERAVDRSLHQSVADEAEEMEDLTVQVTLAMSPAAGGGTGYETEETLIQATKLYIEWLLNGEPSGLVYYNGKPGSFDPANDTMPVIISKSANTAIQFTTEDAAVAAIIVKYYPSTVQTV